MSVARKRIYDKDKVSIIGWLNEILIPAGERKICACADFQCHTAFRCHKCGTEFKHHKGISILDAAKMKTLMLPNYNAARFYAHVNVRRIEKDLGIKTTPEQLEKIIRDEITP